MWGTFLWDVYGDHDREAVANALEMLCSAANYSGFSSAGIYLFWQPDPRELLYIGLAGDLPVRFAQHNELASCEEGGSKRELIAEYFREHDLLGYSVLALSPQWQPCVWRNAARFRHPDEIYRGEYRKWINVLDIEARELIEEVEGGLIEGHKLRFGQLPAWNKIGASRRGRENATPRGELLAAGVLDVDSLLAARRSIRELDETPTYEAYEVWLHLARERAVAEAWPEGEIDNGAILDATAHITDPTAVRERLIEDGYTRTSIVWTFPERGGSTGRYGGVG